jgi:glycosyltransferase involved in cell wall biosynthesis
MKKISIIVPVYNVERYLKECVESILNQTYINFELILVDDGSPDNSGKICDEFALKDNRITVIHKTNGGQSSARNAALEMMTGEYVCFVDSDDLIHNKTLEILYNIITENKADIAAGRFKIFSFNEEIEIESNIEVVSKEISSTTLLQMAISNYDISFSVCNKMFNSNLWREFRFREGTYYEDEDISYKIFDKAKNCILSDYQFYFYRTNLNSTTRKISPRVIEQYYTRKGMYEYIEEKHSNLAPLCYARWFDVSLKIYLQYSVKLKINMRNYTFLKKFERRILRKLDKEQRSLAINYYLIMPYSLMILCLRLRSLIKRIVNIK